MRNSFEFVSFALLIDYIQQFECWEFSFNLSTESFSFHFEY